MADSAYELYKHLSSYRRINDLISIGEPESIHLECKSPTEPRLNKDLQIHLARAISGFSNTAGGVVIWGVSTTKHAHSGLDVLSQIEPLGNALRFQKQVVTRIPVLSTPPAVGYESKVLKRRKSDTRGIVILYIPQSESDPMQSTKDEYFYFRAGDQFTRAPHEMIKRLFATTASPDVYANIHVDMAKKQPGGEWKIPIGVVNGSSAVAENVMIYVEVTNPEACAEITASTFEDISSLNPGRTMFSTDYKKVIHRGLNIMAGDLILKMNSGPGAKKRVDLKINIYANNMRAKTCEATLHVTKAKCALVDLDVDHLY